jgi:hypothetical protein
LQQKFPLQALGGFSDLAVQIARTVAFVPLYLSSLPSQYGKAAPSDCAPSFKLTEADSARHTISYSLHWSVCIFFGFRSRSWSPSGTVDKPIDAATSFKHHHLAQYNEPYDHLLSRPPIPLMLGIKKATSLGESVTTSTNAQR